MDSIAATIRRLHLASAPPGTGESALTPLDDFGSNPGALRAWCHFPHDTIDLPLVVVLHGCTQTAAAYDRGAGWSELAERHGFAVLFPEQQRANNANLCFNWFVADDIARDGGEALSIRQMIGAMLARHAIDPARVFITGLSAGGAMTSVMLATYPELFAGGGIIAGLPYGTATSMPQALQRMRGHGLPGEAATGELLCAASSHAGPWPSISIWHGDADATVVPANARAIVDQWRALHGAASSPDRTEAVDGHQRRVWLGRDGRLAIEEYVVAGMGHGTPLKTSGADGCGVAGPHMLEAGISSTLRLAERWNLLQDAPQLRTARQAPAQLPPISTPPVPPPRPASTPSVQATIEAALRTAGLMR